MKLKKSRKQGNSVLIESDWNLKNIRYSEPVSSAKVVLIESDWNLKILESCDNSKWRRVLIESDWNLKRESIMILRLR